MVHTGFGSYLNPQRVIAIGPVESAPLLRMMDEALKAGRLIDLTYGRKRRTVVRMANGDVVLLAISPEKLAKRIAAWNGHRIREALEAEPRE